ncbi:MAG: Na+/H+ antiporter NhaC [Succinivibrionaceae bacterium]
MTTQISENDLLKSYKPHNFFTAILPFLVLLPLLATSIYIFGDNSSAGPNQVSLFLCTMLTCFIGMWRGLKYEDIERGITNGISTAIPASLILLFIGALIGVWMLSGTVPTIIYYGIQIINPDFFYSCCMLVCAIISFCIGSSWSTAATIGVAFIGIATGLHLSIPITAGAIISGAYFGDKMSPLSETTNLASAVAEVNLFLHIKNMCITTVPTFIISLLIFTFIGLFNATTENIIIDTSLVESLKELYNISLINIIPLIVLVVMAIKRIPALLTIFCGIIAGVLVALFNQQDTFAKIFNEDVNFLGCLKYIWQASFEGVTLNTPNKDVNVLLSGGGMISMLNTIFLILAAISFGSAMEVSGNLNYLIKIILFSVKKCRSILTSTVLSCIACNTITGDQYMSIIIPSRMFKQKYKDMNIKPKVLSRCLEDGATITSVLVPWNTCAVYISGVLGVGCLTYMPYCFFNYLSPCISILFAWLGIGVLRYSQDNNFTEKNNVIKK